MVVSWGAEVVEGLSAYMQAVSLVKRKRLWFYFVVPGLMGIAVVVATSLINGMIIPILSSHVLDTLKQNLPEWMVSILAMGGWGKWLASFLLHASFWILSFLILLLLFKPIILALLSPIFTHLSQVTEELLCSGRN